MASELRGDRDMGTPLPSPETIAHIACSVSAKVPSGRITRWQLFAACEMAASRGYARGQADALPASPHKEDRRMIEKLARAIERADENDKGCDGIASAFGIDAPDISDWSVHLTIAALESMREPSARRADIERGMFVFPDGAKRIGDCNRDELLDIIAHLGAAGRRG